MNNYILDVSGDDFNEAVLNNSYKGPVMVNYWADNAGPCLRLWPVLEKLANDYNGQFLLAILIPIKRNSWHMTVV